MGMESFNAVPEPVVPNKTEKVEDIKKARAMAEAGNYNRSWATDLRKQESGEKPLESGMPSTADAWDVAQRNDQLAKSREKEAGEQFDIAKAEEEKGKE